MRKLGIMLPATLLLAMMLACGSNAPRATPQPTREIEPTFTPVQLVAPTATVLPSPVPSALPARAEALPVLEPTATTAVIAPTATAPAPVAAGPSANDVANLRSGPGTDYATVGNVAAGQALTLVGRNAAGDWYQMADGNWIAAFLVTGAPADLPVVEAVPVAVPVATEAPPVVEQPTNPPFACAGGCDQPPDPSCSIKGNVSSSGEKIYHVIGGGSYDSTVIDPAKGERWFCTGAEAEAAGFRAARN